MVLLTENKTFVNTLAERCDLSNLVNLDGSNSPAHLDVQANRYDFNNKTYIVF